MAIVFPVALVAADAQSAIMHTQGEVWLNGTVATDSTAVLAGDVIETKRDTRADLNIEGSSALIQPESVVKFQGDYLELDHGSILVATSTRLRVRVNCITVEPVSDAWTQYEVTDVNGIVHVSANKSDVRIEHKTSHETTPHANPPQSSDSGGDIVHEGEQGNREESAVCGAAERPIGPGNHPLNTKWLEIGGGAGGGVAVLCALLCHGKKNPDMSPDKAK